MKIFTAAQIRKWDAATMTEQNISQTELMQRAGNVCARWLKKKFDKSRVFLIACGKGGNGGDGLVIARDLLHAGFQVCVLLISTPNEFKGATRDHWNNLTREFPDMANQTVIANNVADLSRLLKNGNSMVIVDALLGTGYKPGIDNPLTGGIIKKLNTVKLPVISIDLPSGLPADSLPSKDTDDTPIVKAVDTLCFQAYKRSFLHPECSGYTGKIHLLDIGLSEYFEREEPSEIYATGLKSAAEIYRPRTKQQFGHKGTFGTVVIVGGSYGKIGAVCLSARAALHAGAGKVFIQAPKCGYEILQSSIAEAMFEPAGDSYVADIGVLKNVYYGIGPGMDTHPESLNALRVFLQQTKEPLVLDADALNMIATDPDALLSLVPANSIITPHPGEFNRLFGNSGDSLQQTQTAQQQAQKWKIVIVLKGHRTAVCTPDGHVCYNLSGNAGMATPGSGDVLTGIITSLLAQGYKSSQAAILGVYLHGLSGDYYARKGAQESLIAGNIIECLPKAFRKLAKRKRNISL